MNKHNKSWTMRDIEYLKENYEYTNNKILAKKLGRTIGSIRIQAGNLGLKKTNEYAMYKGDELLYVGTPDEIAEWHGVKRGTILYYTTPAYARRTKSSDKAIRVFRLED